MKFTNLFEALNIQGATHINSEKNFDLYEIQSYAAAQQFKAGPSNNTPAGQFYTQNERTFNSNINDQTGRKLYFFTANNSDKVILAILSGQNGTLTHAGITLNCENYSFENENNQSELSIDDKDLPLYLLPNLRVDGQVVTPSQPQLIVRDSRLERVLQILYRPSSIQQLLIPSDIVGISPEVFCAAPDIQSAYVADGANYATVMAQLQAINGNDLAAEIADTKIEPAEAEAEVEIEDEPEEKGSVIPDIDDPAAVDVSLCILDENGDFLTIKEDDADKKMRLSYSKIHNRISGVPEIAITGFKDKALVKKIKDLGYGIIIESWPPEILNRSVTQIADYAFMGDPIYKIRSWPAYLNKINRGAFFLCLDGELSGRSRYLPRLVQVDKTAFRGSAFSPLTRKEEGE